MEVLEDDGENSWLSHQMAGVITPNGGSYHTKWRELLGDLTNVKLGYIGDR